MAATPKKKVVRKTTKRKAKTAKQPIKKVKRKAKTAKRPTKKVKRKAPVRRPKGEMLVSVFTPTDGSKHLQECYDSLCGQLYDNWEWVLVPNGTLKLAGIPARMRKDPRVRIEFFPPLEKDETSKIGALKKFAAHHCKGQLYVELDHDDILTNDALREIVAAYKKTGAGFIFSNFVSFREDGSSITYTETSGWESYPVRIDGADYLATRSFDVTPDSLHRIFTAPNHVRVWSKEAYAQVGGHNAELRVCDDFELVSRTYLDKIDFHHIDKCLYLYRQWEGSRSVVGLNAEIQTTEGRLAHGYTHKIIQEGARRAGLPSVTVTHKSKPQDGVLHYPDIGTLSDNSLGWIVGENILQHLTAEEAFAWINVAWDKLAPGGWLSLATPSTDDRGAFQVPTYKSFWNSNSFAYFKDNQAASSIGIKDYHAKFHLARYWDEVPSNMEIPFPVVYSYTDMVAIKDKRRIAGSPRLY